MGNKVSQEDVDELHYLYVETLKAGIVGEAPLAWTGPVGAYLKLRADTLQTAQDDSSRELADQLSARRAALKAKLSAVGSP